jgi:acyl-CoA synthetase (AMP-forming)/AMP-acid ligase II
LAAILCSSGTSGHMKGVCLSHANILGYLKIFNHPEAFRSLSFSPIYWLIGFVSTIFVALRQNDTRIVTSQTFDVDLLVKIIKKHNVNYFQAAPYQLSLLVQSPNLDPRDFIGIKIFFVIGSMVTENLRKEFHSVFPRHPLIIAYGMSESCMSISTTDPKDKIGGLTVGKISPNIHVKIVDQDGQAQDINRTGEILAKPEFKMLVRFSRKRTSFNLYLI